MLAWLTGWPRLTHALLAGLAKFALSTPPITALAPVRLLWQASLGASAGFALFVFLAAAGLGVLPGGILGAPAVSVRQLIVRVFVSVLLAVESLTLTAWVLRFNNFLIEAVTAQGNLLGALREPQASGGLLVVVVTLLPYVGVLLALAVIYAIRMAELLVLIVLAPIAASFLIHPGTQRLTALWAAEFLAVTFLQFAQAVLLELFQVVTVTLPQSQGTAAAIASSLALLVLTIRLPGWMSKFVHSAGQQSASEWLARLARSL